MVALLAADRVHLKFPELPLDVWGACDIHCFSSRRGWALGGAQRSIEPLVAVGQDDQHPGQRRSRKGT